MMYEYSYLIGDLILVSIWLALYFLRKDTRKDMLIMSAVYFFMGPIDIVYQNDWWKPITITNTPIGIESFVFGATMGGLTTVLYTTIFDKKRSSPRIKDSKFATSDARFLFVFFLALALCLVGVYIIGLNSLISTLIAFSVVTIIMWKRRPDLIVQSIFSGILLLTLMFGVYASVEMITPGWIDAFYLFENVPHVILLNVPIDDIFFYFFTGMCLGPLYDYWKGTRTEPRAIAIKTDLHQQV